MIKNAGGIFVPVFEHDLPRLTRFKNGSQYTLELKITRNPDFHKKVFAFFKFCFEHWSADNTDLQFMDESEQFNSFRKNLTVLAGYKIVTYTIDRRMRVEAQSLAFANMKQEEFERCYTALINAASKHIFKPDTTDTTLNQLRSFF
ncbi:hypothetical protein CBW53_03000 [Yersinia frederiksenii]|nr:hypothetical protein CBW53_03000 [Yersinia frederiksenii]